MNIPNTTKGDRIQTVLIGSSVILNTTNADVISIAGKKGPFPAIVVGLRGKYVVDLKVDVEKSFKINLENVPSAFFPDSVEDSFWTWPVTEVFAPEGEPQIEA